MSNTANCIRVGDVLCLADLDAGGFLTGNDDLPTRIFVEEMRKFNPSESNHQFELCQFRVFQRFQYGAWKELQDGLSHYGITAMDGYQWADLMNSNDPIFSDLRYKYENFRREKETNWMEFRRTAGRPVRYGSVIQLYHMDSKKFLTQSKDRAWSNRLAMELLLDQDGNQGSWWKLMPTDKGCVEGDNVLHGDQVQLESLTFTNKYISVFCDSANSNGAKDSAQHDATVALVQGLNSVHESVEDILEVNVSADSSKFKVIPIKAWSGSKVDWSATEAVPEEDEEESLALRGMEVVTLARSKDRVLLYGCKQGRVVWADEDAAQKGEEMHWAAALWRLKPCSAHLAGERLQAPCKGLLLQHLVTGMYLTEVDAALRLTEHIRAPASRWQAALPKQHASSAESPAVDKLVDGATVWLKRGARKGHNEQWLGLDVQLAKKQRSLARKGLSNGNLLELKDAVLREGSSPEGCDLVELRFLPELQAKPILRGARCTKLLATAVGLLRSLPDTNTAIGESSNSVPPSPSHPHPSSPSVGPPSADDAGSTNEAGSTLTAAALASLGPARKPSMNEMVEARVLAALREFVATLGATLERTLWIIYALSSSSTNEDSGGPSKACSQSLLHHLGGLDVVVELVSVLLSPFSPAALRLLKTSLPQVHSVAKMCYKVLEQAAGRHAANKRALLQHLSLMQTHLPANVGAYSAMLVVYGDADELLQQLDHSVFEDQLQALRETRHARGVSLILESCRTNGVPLSKNQDRWSRLMLEEAPDLIHVMELCGEDVLLKDARTGAVLLSVKSLHEKMCEERVLQVGETDGAEGFPEAQLYCYHLKMLQLLCALLLGRNDDALQRVLAKAEGLGLGFQQLLRLIRLRDLPHAMCSCCCELVHCLYIDRDPNKEVSNLFYTRMWTTLDWEDETESKGELWATSRASAQERESDWSADLDFAELKLAIVDKLQELFGGQRGITYQETSKNQCVLALVSLLSALLDFGFFHSFQSQLQEQVVNFTEVRLIAPTLLDVVDCRYDEFEAPTLGQPMDTDARFEPSEQAELVVQRSILILRMFSVFLDCELNSAINEMVLFWEQTMSAAFGCRTWEDACRLILLSDSDPHPRQRQHDSDTAGQSQWQSPSQSRLTLFSSRNRARTGVHPTDRDPSGGSHIISSQQISISVQGNHVWPAEGSDSASLEDRSSNRSASKHSKRLYAMPERRGTQEEREAVLTDSDGRMEGSSVSSDETLKNGTRCPPCRLAGPLSNSSHHQHHHHSVLSDRARPLSLQDYAQDPGMWEKSPPWSQEDVANFADKIFMTETVLPELAASNFCNFASPHELPRFVKILLDLSRFKYKSVKEHSVAFLLRIFRQRTAYAQTVRKTNLICHPLTASAYCSIRRALGQLQVHVKQLRRLETVTVDNKTLQDNALLRCQSLVSELNSWMSGTDTATTKKILMDLSVHTIAINILHIPQGRTRSMEAGKLDIIASSPRHQLFAAVYELLSGLCQESKEMQRLLLPMSDLLVSHVGVENLFVERLLAALVQDNMDALEKFGKSWCKLFLHDLPVRYGCVRPQWLGLARALGFFKGQALKDHLDEIQMLIQSGNLRLFSLVDSSDGWLELLAAHRGGELEADVAYSCHERDSERELARNLCLLDLLAATCENKDPAADVFAASYLPFGVIASTVASLHAVNTQNTALAYGLKAALFRFLSKVYLGTEVKRLAQSLHSSSSGLWPQPAAFIADLAPPSSPPASISLMECVDEELAAFASTLRRRDKIMQGAQEVFVESQSEFVFAAALPFLASYFQLPKYLAPERGNPAHAALASRIFDHTHEILQLISYMSYPAHEALTKHFDIPAAWTALRNMQSLGEVYSRKDVKPLEAYQAVQRVNMVQREVTVVVETVLDSFKALTKSTSRVLLKWSNDTCILFTAGMDLQAETVSLLPSILARAGRIALYDRDDRAGTIYTRSREEATHAEVLGAVMAVLRSESWDGDKVRELLDVLRCSLYVFDPRHPDKMPEEGRSEQWAAFQAGKVMAFPDDSDKSVVVWVQNRADAVGMTSYALQLASHPTKRVQVASVELLLSLLQGGNLRVQESLGILLRSPKLWRFFQVLDTTMEGAILLISDVRSLMAARGLDLDGASVSTTEEEQAERYRRLNGIGKQSLLMLTLRLLQLMCRGRCVLLQSLMLQQAGSTSFNLLGKCLRLFGAMEPALCEALRNRDGSLAVLAVQLLDTIRDMCAGNQRLQREVIASDMFFHLNRILCSMQYDCSALQQQERAEDVGETINDLKCLLKVACLRCCLSFFESESVTELRLPQHLLGILQLKAVLAQLRTTGALLGFSDRTRAPAGPQNLAGSLLRSSSSAGSFLQRRLSVGALFEAELKGEDKEPPEAFGSDDLFVQQAAEAAVSRQQRAVLDRELFLLYRLMLYLQLYDPAVEQQLQSFKQENRVLSAVLEARTSWVELARPRNDGEQQRVVKVFFSLTEQTERFTKSKHFLNAWKAVIASIPRENATEKAECLLARVKDVLDQMVWFHYIDRFAAGRLLLSYRRSLQSLSLILALAITSLLLLFYGIPMDPNTGEVLGEGRFWPKESGTKAPPAGYEYGPYAFANQTSDPAGLGATMGSVLSTSDLAVKYRLSLTSRWRSLTEWQLFPAMRHVALALAALHVVVTLLSSIAYLLLDLPLSLHSSSSHGVQMVLHRRCLPAALLLQTHAPNLQDRSRLYLATVASAPPGSLQAAVGGSAAGRAWGWKETKAQLCKGLPVVHHAILLCMSLLGALQSPFFYVYCMLDYLRMSGGRIVLRSLVIGGPNLARSFTLGVFVLTIFGFVTYSYFSSTAIIEDSTCHSPFQCVSKIIVDSFRGDITTVLGQFSAWAYPPLVVWSDQWNTFRTFYIFATLIFWSLLLQPVMQGQIIDAFAEIRGKATATKTDLEQKCFVTGVDRHTFAQFPGEWEIRRGGKFALRYLLYLKFLFDEDSDDYNDLELEVAESFDAKRVDFLPSGTFFAQDQKLQSKRCQRSMDQELGGAVAEMRGEIEELRERCDTIVAMLTHHTAQAVQSSAGPTRSGLIRGGSPDAAQHEESSRVDPVEAPSVQMSARGASLSEMEHSVHEAPIP